MDNFQSITASPEALAAFLGSDAYIRAFDKMLEERKRRGKMQGTWRAGTTGRDIFHWWMEDGVLPGQMEFDDLLLEEDEEW